MKKFILTLVTLSMLASPLQAQPVFNDADIAAAKNAGAAAAGTGAQASYKVDANGNLVLGADGKPVVVPRNNETMQGDLRKFQADTGISGVDPVSSPGHGSRTGLANVNVTQSFTFNCRVPPGSTHAAGSLGFKVDACEKSGNSIAAVRFSICEQSAGAGVCGTGDFKNPVRVTANTYANYKGVQLGLGCNTAGTCQMTVNGSYQVGGNDQTLKNDAGAVQSNVREGLQKAVTEQDYAGQMTEIGEPLVNGGGGTSTTTNPGGTTTCAANPVCLKESTTTNTYTKSCMRTFPLTERKTRFNYTSYKTCEMEKFGPPPKPKNPTDKPEAQKPDTNSCDVPLGQGPAGMTRVGKTEDVCHPYADVEKDGTGCASTTWTEYYVDMSARDVLGHSDSPAPVAGACDTRENSDTTLMLCESGNWFGRTSSSSCQLTFSNDGTGGGSRGAVDLDFRNVAGCGFCLAPTIGTTCYAKPAGPGESEFADVQDSCDGPNGIDLTGCSLKTVTEVITTSSGGLVHSQREIYECTRSKNVCVSWGPPANGSTSTTCVSNDIAMGTDKPRQQQQSDGSMNAALVAAALADSTAQGLEVGSSDAVPKIFGGEDMRCARPTGGLGTILQKNCCRIELERPKKGNIIQGGCSLDEAKLAAARRSSYATYIGEYCSRSVKFLGFRKCLEQTQTYCVFPGILPRLVQEQGRAQLQQMLTASSGATVQHGNLSYSYYSASQQGNWAPRTTVNGVTFTAWQWPSFCSDPAKAGEQAVNDPTARECPGVVTTWLAACDIPTGCGPLPEEPLDGSVQWKLASADPLQNVSTAVSRYGAATGACSTASNQCTYNLSAWPAGVGGRAVVAKDLTWTLFSQEQPAANGQTPASFQMNNIGDLMFKGYAVPGTAGQAAPATVPLGFSRDGGQTWTNFSLPTDLRGTEVTLPNSEVTITGHCEGASNTCVYRIVGTVEVAMKPWGPAQGPDCSGYTAGQLSALDFGKMDLSEWLATVMDKVGAQTPQNLAATANAQFQSFNSLFQSGQVQAKSPAVNFARAVPAEGFGPFTVRLAVAGVWPEVTGDSTRDTDVVTSVMVDWGDCKPPEALPAVPADQGRGYGASHQYLTPDAENYPCLKTSADDNRNIIHRIKLTVNTTRSGQQVKEVSVENAWARFPGADSHNSNVTTTKSAPTTTSTVPAPPKGPAPKP